MSCKCSYHTDEFHGYGCTVTGGSCMFVIPDSIACAIEYSEGPDADKTKEELGRLVEDGKSPMYEFAIKMANNANLECTEEDDGYLDGDYLYL